ncbi:MAG: ATP-binding protein [Bacteroidales bacterium]|nr:ATP-binding protein [Bacteroidales bacterium]MBN2748498.1 ATP-binding protein [Bacteroidales bacterium]
MKDYSLEQKKELRDKIIALQEQSGLSGNEFATSRLGFTNGSKFSHVRNNWDKQGLVGIETWEVIEKYVQKTENYRIIPTANLKKVWETCERAYALKKPMAVVGEGGFGKTTALEKYKEYIESQRRFKVVLFDASMVKTNKQFIEGLMRALDCYKPGTMAFQLKEMRAYATSKDLLVCIDEVSAREGHSITIIKDVMTALKDICGIVFTGTPYFINNLNKGAIRDKHLFSETRDRIFMLPEQLNKPTAEEAEAIFRANGITSKEELDILLGRKPEFIPHSWLAKRTFRGIRDCIDLLKMAELPAIDYSSITF